jgi:hypothetical protein
MKPIILMSNTLQRLTISIALLAGVASLGGLMIPTLYQDNALYKTAWKANDLITLLLAPAVFISYQYYKRGTTTGRLVWLGLLLYMFYNYAFYLFGAAFNRFFLIYAALFTLALYALLLGLREVILNPAPTALLSPLKRKLIAIFLLGVAIPLASVELAQCWRFIFSGRSPEIPALVIALDLTLVVPNLILAALLLLGKRTWGIILSAMMLVKSFTYGLVLVTGTTFIVLTDMGPLDPLLPFYVFVSGGGLVLLIILLKDFTLKTL